MIMRKIPKPTLVGLLIAIMGLCIALPLGHNAIMATREALVHHAFRHPDFWRNMLITMGCFICGGGLIIALLPYKALTVHISDRVLFGTAYLYMIVPTIIFFLGWLELSLGLFFSAILLFGFYWHIKYNYSNQKNLDLTVGQLVLIGTAILVWVYMTGIGGFMVQRYDLHWRNACLRDLIDYSWPVIFPETGNALGYYFNFWMIPALVGKMLGLTAANITLYVWTAFGIVIATCVVLKYLNFSSKKKIIVFILIFITFSGIDVIGTFFTYFANKGVFLWNPFAWQDAFTGFQYVPLNSHIEWAYNQTICSWIAISIFLNERDIKSLALIGLCAFPFAPIPFIGLFVIFILWALFESTSFVKEKKSIQILKNIFSIPNICATLSIFIVFFLFFKTNTSITHDGKISMIGFSLHNKKLDILTIISIVLFFTIDVYAYVLLILPNYKKDKLFYIINLPLLLVPFIRLGAGRDFVLRAWIPAQFSIMIFLVKTLLSEKSNRLTFRTFLLCFCIGASSFNFIAAKADYIHKIYQRHSYPLVADDIHSFAEKNAVHEYGVKKEITPHYINMLVLHPEQTVFFKYLAKTKSKKSYAKDIKVYESYLHERGLSVCDGNYTIQPKRSQKLYLSDNGEMLTIKDSSYKAAALSTEKSYLLVNVAAMNWGDYFRESDQYRLVFADSDKRLDVPYGRINENGDVWSCNKNKGNAQKFNLQPVGDFYKIIWNGYALSYDTESSRVYLAYAEENDNQLWQIERAEQTEQSKKFDEWKKSSSYNANEYRIRRTFILSDWLKEAKNASSRYTLFLAVCDEAAVSITDEVIEKMQALGLKMSLKKKVQHGYVAVIDRGNVVFEEMAPVSNVAVVTDGKLDNKLNYHIESAGLPAGNLCSIIINGHQHAVNKRGLNFVVYDNELNKVVDSVCFDTWAKGMPCYR